MRNPPRILLTLLAVTVAVVAVAMVPADLLDMRTCGIGALSPDGRLLVYTVGEYDRDAGRTRTTVHLRDLDTGEQQILFTPVDRAGGFVFSPDSGTIAFTRAVDDGTEVWLMAADGTARRRVAGPGRFGGLVWAPGGDALAHVVSDRDPDYEGRPGEVTVADDLGWRHLGEGEREGMQRQLHVLNLATGEDRAHPTPDLDAREVAWSPDGERLVVSAKPRRYLGRTLNTELYLVDRAGGPPARLSNNPGPDAHPIWLDGGEIACQSHADSLHESEPSCLVFRDASTGRETRRLMTDVDDCVWGVWHHDGAFFYRAASRGTAAIFRADGGMLTPSGWNVWDVRFGGGRAVCWGQSQTVPGQIFVVDLATGERTTLLDPNERWSDRVGLIEPQRFEVAVEGRTIEGWVYLPEDHVPGRKLPTVLSIHGGPEWMYGGYFLPEFHVLPAFGYAVIAANPTGSTGYGRAFMNGVRGDWNGRPARELMAVLDYAEAEGWTDLDRTAVMGGSYGGHLAAVLTTKTTRFRAAAVDRMYPQTEAFWGATDEKWFPEWEFGGRPFDPAARDIYRRNNPYGEVGEVRTPTLISHGLRDFRCPQDGSVGWYSALQALGVPSRLLRFHDEGHGLRGRANQVFYLDQLLAWFERWVLEASVHE